MGASWVVCGRAGCGPPARHWKVDRIEAAEPTEIRFNRPDDFDLEGHFAKSFGVFHGDGEIHVKVRFSPTVSRYVEESRWHASQTLTKEKDGSLLAEFDLDSTEEIMRWIMSFGRYAEALEPEKLRREIGAEIAALDDTYRPSLAAGRGTSNRIANIQSASQHDKL